MKSLLAFCVLAFAQAQKPEFEVVSVYPSVPDNNHIMNTSSGFFRTHDVPLKRLVARAYQVSEDEVFCNSGWIESEGFDIRAKIPDELTKGRGADTLPQMIQGLLADRFHLVAHRELRQVQGFLLVVAKKGIKMETSKEGGPSSHMSSNNTLLKAKNVSMTNIATFLTHETGRFVVDKTGLSERFNFELKWLPERAADANSTDGRASIFVALQEQLGLKLESAKVPISAVVIDSAERPAGN